uniref:hypothetical protein n=1 Tax=Mycobacterium celatum TaxID=28045 RepID=UPI001ABAA329
PPPASPGGEAGLRPANSVARLRRSLLIANYVVYQQFWNFSWYRVGLRPTCNLVDFCCVSMVFVFFHLVGFGCADRLYLYCPIYQHVSLILSRSATPH